MDILWEVFVELPPSRHSSSSSSNSHNHRSHLSGGTSSSVSISFVVLAIIIIATIIVWRDDNTNRDAGNYPSKDVLYLLSNGDNVYRKSNDSREYDKSLVWDNEYQSYYDKDTYCYVYYNEDVSPHVWQYWYEGISSDFGDYGWMEYRAGRWYIEKSYNNWVVLPSDYNIRYLWYID